MMIDPPSLTLRIDWVWYGTNPLDRVQVPSMSDSSNPERGIVIGYAILYYGDRSRRMQINEVFRILDGGIRMMNNIGMTENGITTSGFTQ